MSPAITVSEKPSVAMLSLNDAALATKLNAFRVQQAKAVKQAKLPKV